MLRTQKCNVEHCQFPVSTMMFDCQPSFLKRVVNYSWQTISFSYPSTFELIYIFQHNEWWKRLSQESNNFFFNVNLVSPIEIVKRFFRAAERGDSRAVSEMVRAGVSLGSTDEYGDTALHRAVSFDRIDMVYVLLNKGAKVNAQNHNGSTPLHKAICSSSSEIIESLLDHDADQTIVDVNGDTPLNYACRKGKAEVMHLLAYHK